MIVTVTLNTAVDAAAMLGRLEVGAVNRSHALSMFPGGKGVNVAKAVAALGCEVVATGFVGAGPAGRLLRDELDRIGVRHDFVELPGDTRLTFLLYDESAGTETIVNNPAGYRVSDGDFEALRQKLSSLMGEGGFLALSGSVAVGCDAMAYADLIELAHSHGAKAVLDTSGEALAEGVRARPFMVKPTARELSDLLGREIETEEQVIAAARELQEGGLEAVVVSLGAKGAIALCAGETYVVRPPTVEVVSAIGAGDAMVAGVLLSLSRGETFAHALRLGTAAAVSSLRRHGAGVCTREEAEGLRSAVLVRPLR